MPKRRFECVMCGHVIITDGTDYGAQCPKCRGKMIETPYVPGYTIKTPLQVIDYLTGKTITI